MLLPYMETGRVEAGCDEAGRGWVGGGGVRRVKRVRYSPPP